MEYKTIYSFSEAGSDWDGAEADAKKILGGKGAGLVNMCAAGMPVPPGFTITTEVCNAYRLLKETQTSEKLEAWFDKLLEGVNAHMNWLHDQFGYTPLVSVRSGAPISMPGMMDTILNVGLTEDNWQEWADRLGERAAIDSQRRLIQMLGSTAYGVPHEVFEFQLARTKKEHGAEQDTDLSFDGLQVVVNRYLEAFEKAKDFAFPINDADQQLKAAIRAVFDSWMNPRAIEYRKINQIDEAMGTAVNVQAMVFGNMGETSGSGVAFTRDPSTGEKVAMAEYLPNAQGEDVVAGIRTPYKLDVQSQTLFDGKNSFGVPEWGVDLMLLMVALENMYDDMVDLEFTVQQGKLWMLQSRSGKRSAAAAFKIANDLASEGVLSTDKAFKRLTREQFKVMRRPSIDPGFNEAPQLVGIPASPGVVSGKPVFSAAAAVECGEPCILITHETTPDDIAGMAAAAGILTQTGGATSHAAVVARAMDKTCVVGTTDLDFEQMQKAKKVTIDGASGKVWIDIDVPVVDSSDSEDVRRVIDWSLIKLGRPEKVALVPEKIRPGIEYVVVAAEWWGATEVLNATLNELAAMDEATRSRFVLDVERPASFARPEDKGLSLLFGEEPHEWHFLDTLRSELVARSEKLKGLRIGYSSSTTENAVKDLLEHYGAFVGMAVPADYATHANLG